ncbi:TrkH family potassium uptake protein [Synechococcus sp. PCC 7336]|uniref:TrkH family potassium uptake protein n=1 Tax=Synechococcus sp. PCC 7336 TaxID=195250 RepID=UPI00034A945E|nr:TrkH family potassium uptake protein [Synechococcus sp. PCC 7336]
MQVPSSWWQRFSRSLTPPQTICLGFLATILVGTVLLMLPWSTAAGEWNHWLMALFTSTSAVCVTGLIVADTGTHFSPFGQMVLLALIQVGGLGYMTATSFLLLIVGRRLSLRDRTTMRETVGAALGSSTALQLVSAIVGMTALFESLGALLLAQVWVPQLGWKTGLWVSVFHSVSAFNNAGFSLFSNSMVGYQTNYITIFTLSALIVLGGIGFSIIYELYEWSRRIWLGDRSIQRENFTLNFKVAVSTSLLLLLAGTAFFLGTEWDNPETLGSLSFADRLLAALFQSVTARTAGFNSIHQSALESSSLFVVIILMFIGASPGGTGGGVKTTTLGTLLACTRSALRGGDSSVLVFRRTVPETLVNKAVGILMGSAMLVALSTTLLSLIDGDRFAFLDLLFEAVSAYATVGLSALNTADLSPLSHLVLIPTMYCGRVGILLLVSALYREPAASQLIKYPEETFLIG